MNSVICVNYYIYGVIINIYNVYVKFMFIIGEYCVVWC